jgi:hypothetical protein
LDHAAAHFGDALDEDFLGAGLAAAALVIQRHDLVADRRFDAGAGAEGRVHDAEIEPRGLLTLSTTSGLSFASRPGSWISMRLVPTGRITGSATPKAFTRLLMISIALCDLFLLDVDVALAGERALVDLEGHGDATREIEAALEAALGTAQHLAEEDIVALLDVLQRILETDVGEVLREVDLAVLADRP